MFLLPTYQLDQKQSSHMPVGTHHLPTGKKTELFVFFLSPFPLATFHRDFPADPIPTSSVIWALSRPCHGSTTGLRGATERNVKLRQKDLIWKRRNAFHIRSQKI